MVELDLKAALKSFNPASVTSEKSKFVCQQSIRIYEAVHQKLDALTNSQHPLLINME